MLPPAKQTRRPTSGDGCQQQLLHASIPTQAGHNHDREPVARDSLSCKTVDTVVEFMSRMSSRGPADVDLWATDSFAPPRSGLAAAGAPWVPLGDAGARRSPSPTQFFEALDVTSKSSPRALRRREASPPPLDVARSRGQRRSEAFPSEVLVDRAEHADLFAGRWGTLGESSDRGNEEVAGRARTRSLTSGRFDTYGTDEAEGAALAASASPSGPARRSRSRSHGRRRLQTEASSGSRLAGGQARRSVVPSSRKRKSQAEFRHVYRTRGEVPRRQVIDWSRLSSPAGFPLQQALKDLMTTSEGLRSRMSSRSSATLSGLGAPRMSTMLLAMWDDSAAAELATHTMHIAAESGPMMLLTPDRPSADDNPDVDDSIDMTDDIDATILEAAIAGVVRSVGSISTPVGDVLRDTILKARLQTAAKRKRGPETHGTPGDMAAKGLSSLPDLKELLAPRALPTDPTKQTHFEPKWATSSPGATRARARADLHATLPEESPIRFPFSGVRSVTHRTTSTQGGIAAARRPRLVPVSHRPRRRKGGMLRAEWEAYKARARLVRAEAEALGGEVHSPAALLDGDVSAVASGVSPERWHRDGKLGLSEEQAATVDGKLDDMRRSAAELTAAQLAAQQADAIAARAAAERAAAAAEAERVSDDVRRAVEAMEMELAVMVEAEKNQREGAQSYARGPTEVHLGEGFTVTGVSGAEVPIKSASDAKRRPRKPSRSGSQRSTKSVAPTAESPAVVDAAALAESLHESQAKEQRDAVDDSVQDKSLDHTDDFEATASAARSARRRSEASDTGEALQAAGVLPGVVTVTGRSRSSSKLTKEPVSALDRLRSVVRKGTRLTTKVRTRVRRMNSLMSLQVNLHEAVQKQTDFHILHQVGREAQLRELQERVQLAHDSNPSNRVPVALIGAPGIGKTSLMTKLADELERDSSELFPLLYIIGASVESTDGRELLCQFCRDLSNGFGLSLSPTYRPENYHLVRAEAARLLGVLGRKASAAGSTAVIIMDGLNLLTPQYDAQSLDWLPSVAPPGVVLIVSTVTGSRAFDALHARRPSPHIIHLPGLAPEEVRAALRSHMGDRTGAEEIVETISRSPNSKIPRYVVYCCDELNSAAAAGAKDFELVRLARELPHSMKALVAVMLQREEDKLAAYLAARGNAEDWKVHRWIRRQGVATGVDDRGRSEPLSPSDSAFALLRNAFAMLIGSRGGLRQSELAQLLAPPGDTMLSLSVFREVIHSLDRLAEHIGTGGQSVFGLYQDAVIDAVGIRYVTHSRHESFDPDNPRGKIPVPFAYSIMEGFYGSVADPDGDESFIGTNSSAFFELLYYQVLNLDLYNLHRTLGGLRFIEAVAAQGKDGIQRLLDAYNRAIAKLKEARYSSLKQQLRDLGVSREDELSYFADFAAFVGSHRTILLRQPYSAFQLAMNQPDKSAPAAAARELLQLHSDSLLHYMAPDEALETFSPEELAIHQQGIARGISAVPRWFYQWMNSVVKRRLLREAGPLRAEASCIASTESEGSTLAAVGLRDGSCIFLHMATGRVVREIAADHRSAKDGEVRGHTKAITCCSFTADSHLFATGGHDSRIAVWDPSTGELVCTVSGHIRSVTAIAWIENDNENGSRSLAVMESADEIGKGDRVPVPANTLLPRAGRAFVSASLDRSLKLWNQTKHSGSDAVSFHAIWVLDFLRSPFLALRHNRQTGLLVGGRADGEVAVWDATAVGIELLGLCQFTAHDYTSVTCVDIDEQGEALATGGLDNQVSMWRSSPKGWELVPFVGRGHSGGVTSVIFTKHGLHIASCGLDSAIIIWSVSSCCAVSTLLGHTGAVYGLAFSHGSEPGIVSCAYDRCVKQWDTSVEPEESGGADDGDPADLEIKVSRSKRRRSLGTANGAAAAAAAAVSAAAGAASRDGSNISNTRVATPPATSTPMAQPKHAGAVTAFAVCRSGAVAASGGADCEIRIWDLTEFRASFALVGHSAEISSLAFNHVGTVLASGDTNGRICLWSGPLMTNRFTISAHVGSSVTALAIAPSHGVHGDIEQETKRATSLLRSGPQQGLLSPGSPQNATNGTPIAFSHDDEAELDFLSENGRLIVFSGGSDGMVKAWAAETGRPWVNQPDLKLDAAVKLLRICKPASDALVETGLPVHIRMRTGFVQECVVQDLVKPAPVIHGRTVAHESFRLVTVDSKGLVVVLDLARGFEHVHVDEASNIKDHYIAIDAPEDCSRLATCYFQETATTADNLDTEGTIVEEKVVDGKLAVRVRQREPKGHKKFKSGRSQRLLGGVPSGKKSAVARGLSFKLGRTKSVGQLLSEQAKPKPAADNSARRKNRPVVMVAPMQPVSQVTRVPLLTEEANDEAPPNVGVRSLGRLGIVPQLTGIPGFCGSGTQERSGDLIILMLVMRIQTLYRKRLKRKREQAATLARKKVTDVLDVGMGARLREMALQNGEVDGCPRPASAEPVAFKYRGTGDKLWEQQHNKLTGTRRTDWRPASAYTGLSYAWSPIDGYGEEAARLSERRGSNVSTAGVDAFRPRGRHRRRRKSRQGTVSSPKRRRASVGTPSARSRGRSRRRSSGVVPKTAGPFMLRHDSADVKVRPRARKPIPGLPIQWGPAARDGTFFRPHIWLVKKINKHKLAEDRMAAAPSFRKASGLKKRKTRGTLSRFSGDPSSRKLILSQPEVALQARMKSFLQRRDREQETKAAIRLQSITRGHTTRNLMGKQDQAARVLQERVRALHAGKRARARMARARTGKQEREGTCRAVAFSVDGTLLAAGGSGFVAVYEAARPQLGPIAEFPLKSSVTAVGMASGMSPESWPGFDGDFRRVAEPGDGKGGIGILLVGDASGNVMLLKLMDTVRYAEGELMAQEVASGARSRVTSRISSAARTRAGSYASASGYEPPQELVLPEQEKTVYADTEREGYIYRLPVTLLNTEAKDVEFAQRLLTDRLGVRLPAAPFPVLPCTTDGDRLDEFDDTSFFDSPRAVICSWGGAGGLHAMLAPNLKTMLGTGIVEAAISCGALVVDGGTKSGVMEMLGAGLRLHDPGTLRLIGVSPEGVCNVPATDVVPALPAHPHNAELEGHHSHSVLTPSDEWGGETTTMFALVKALQDHLPCVGVVSNGGFITKVEALNAVRSNIPIIVVAGSGRLANDITRYISQRRDQAKDFDVDSITDDMTREIIRDGRLHLIDVTESPYTMQSKLLSILSAERERLVSEAE